MPRSIDECEIRKDGSWARISVADAVLVRNADLRCIECHGRVRAHQNYIKGAKAHFVHVIGHSGCSTTPRAYSGIRSRHPEALV